MRRKIRQLAAAAVLAVCAGWAPAQEPATRPATSKPSPKSIQRVKAIQQDAREQWLELLKSIDDVSSKLEKTDPQTARVLATAAQRAREAFIAEDMSKVIQLLDQGLMVPADTTQAMVVRRLRDVLEILRGASDDLETMLIKLEDLAGLIDALQVIIKQQKVLERQSKLIAFGGPVAEKLAVARKDALALGEAQKQLLDRTKGLVLDPVGLRLCAEGQGLNALMARQEALMKALADPFPSPDAMAANMVKAKGIANQAGTVRLGIRTTMNDKGVAEPIAAAGAAAEAAGCEAGVAKMIAELEKAAKALAEDNLDNARVAAAEAKLCLKEAGAAIQKTMGKLKGSSAMSEVIAAQEKLLGRFQALDAMADDLAPVDDQEEMHKKPREQGLVVRGFFGGSPPARGGGDAPARGPTSQPGASDAEPVAEVPAVLAALRGYDKPATMVEQERWMLLIDLVQQRFGAAMVEISSLRETPRYADQQRKQVEIADALSMIANGKVPGLAPGDKGGSNVLTTDVMATLGKASERGTAAAGFLGQEKAAPANVEQNEVLKLLAQALYMMDSLFQGFATLAEKDMADQFVAILQRLAINQKRVNADTIALWGKKLPDGTYRRAEQLGFVTTASAQGHILVELTLMETFMKKAMRAHAIVTFPPVVPLILGRVKDYAGMSKERLIALDGAEKTQKIQKQISDWLEGMYNAMMPQSDTLDTPPQWGENGFGNPTAGATDNVAMIRMLLMLQGEINDHTKELEAGRGAGKASGEYLKAEFGKMAALERQITLMIETMLYEMLNPDPKR
jgi:hypothetical protein